MKEPRWEWGYRCHGYWIGETRWGFVGVPPGKIPQSGGYGWEYMPHGIVGNPPLPEHQGRTNTLKQAKQAIEKAHREFIEPSAKNRAKAARRRRLKPPDNRS